MIILIIAAVVLLAGIVGAAARGERRRMDQCGRLSRRELARYREL